MEVEAPLEELITLGKSISENVGMTGGQFTNGPWDGAYSHELEIPEGYECYEVENAYHAHWHAGAGPIQIHGNMLIGNKRLTFNTTSLGSQGVGGEFTINKDNGFSPVEGILPISIRTREVGTFSLNVIANCRRKEEVYNQWRMETYIQLREAYDLKLQEYKEAMLAACTVKANVTTEEGQDYRMNPLMARSIEQRELKRVALEMITKPFGFDIGKENYVRPLFSCHSNYDVNQTAAFANHAAHVKFLEEAVDWEIMSYTLYPYYWAAERLWGELQKTTSESDYIFQSFLQSGMAKMLVPVRAGYEKAFMFYLDTGTLWNSDSIVSDNNDGLYQSIIDELQLELNEEGYPMTTDENGRPVVDIEAKWKTRIPTALTVIQKYAASLEDDGLPCACDEDKSIANTKDGKHNILGTVQDETDPITE